MGIEIRNSSIRIVFTHEGKRYRERLVRDGRALKPSPVNEAEAAKIAAMIDLRIQQGTFRLAEFFPESKHVATCSDATLGTLANRWLKIKDRDLANNTRIQYENALEIWKTIFGAKTPISAINYDVLADKIADYAWASNKCLNNYLIPLRGVFKLAYKNNKDNPLASWENYTVKKKKPNPLSQEQRDKILADLRANHDPRVYAYFLFAFFTGMRPQEIIALRWADLDEATGSIRVQRVRIRGVDWDDTKTHEERDVDLVPMAKEALAIMKPYTFHKASDIFENPETGLPWESERKQREKYWQPCLEKLGIPMRGAYHTRHTFATIALMGGANPAYVAPQMGHTNTKTFFENYAKWIQGADRGAARRMMEQAMARPDTGGSHENCTFGVGKA